MSLETLSHTPPSRDLLDQLTRTVTTRWREFNQVIDLPDFAKNLDSRYVEMKTNYTLITTELSKLSSDTELRSNQAIRSHMEDFLSKVSAYMASPDAEAKYRPTLERAQSEIADLKRQIYIEQAQQSRDQSKEQVSAQTASRLEQVAVPTTAAGAVTLEGSRTATPGVPASSTSDSPSRPGDESAQKGNTWLDKISHFGDVWDLANKVKEKSGFFAAASFFFATIFAKDKIAEMASKYGIEVTGMSSASASSSGESVQEVLPKVEQTPHKYNFSITQLQTVNKSYLNPNESIRKQIIDNSGFVLQSSVFRSQNFADLRTLFGGYNGGMTLPPSSSPLGKKIDEILAGLNRPADADQRAGVWYALRTVYGFDADKDKRTFASSQLERIHATLQKQPDYKNYTIQSAVEHFSKELLVANKLTDALRDPEKAIKIEINSDGTVSGEFNELVKAHFGVETLKYIATKHSETLPQSRENIGPESAQMQGEIGKLLEFRDGLKVSIPKNEALMFAKSSEYAHPLIAQIDKLTYMEAFRLHTLLGGATQIDTANTQQMLILYSFVGASLSDVHPRLGGNYQGDLLHNTTKGALSFVGDGVSKIPPGVFSEIQSVLKAPISSALRDGSNLLDKSRGIMETAPIEGAIMASSGIWAYTKARIFGGKGRTGLEVMQDALGVSH